MSASSCGGIYDRADFHKKFIHCLIFSEAPFLSQYHNRKYTWANLKMYQKRPKAAIVTSIYPYMLGDILLL